MTGHIIGSRRQATASSRQGASLCAVVLALLLLAAACGEDPSNPSKPDGDADAPPSDAVLDDVSVADSADATVNDATGDGVGADAPDDGEPVIGDTHPRIWVVGDARARLIADLGEPTAAATRFRDMVDAELSGTDVYAFSAWHAALMYQLSGQQAYGRYAVDMIEADVVAAEAAIAAGERPAVSGDSYLYIGEQIGSLALTYDWCWDLLTASQRQRWLAYANQAVWNVWHHTEAQWGETSHPWSGWSVDNPSNNYYYSFLRATMLLGLAARGEHADANGWIEKFRTEKIAGQLVPTFQSQLAGGGSREGTGYGVSMAHLFELYAIWEASTGERIADLTPHARASLAAMLHQTAPTLDRIAPVGDHARDSSAALFDYHRNYVQTLVWLFPDHPLAPHAARWLTDSSVPRMSQRFMFVYDFLFDTEGAPTAALDEIYPAYYAPGTGQISIRASWQTDATWLYAIAGPYTESHAHRDQGSLLVYKRGWLADDQNLYSHSGIRQEELLHNLVRFVDSGEVVRMRADRSPAELVALAHASDYSYLAIDATPVYDGQAGVVRSEREIVFVPPNLVVVFDRADGSAAGQRVWQLNAPLAPTVAGDVTSVEASGSSLAVTRVHPATVATSTVDWTTDDDMSAGWRVDTSHEASDGRSRFLHVLSLDGSASSVTAADESGQLGAEATLDDGRRVVVRFAEDQIGASIAIYAAGGDPIVEATPARMIQTMPLLAP